MRSPAAISVGLLLAAGALTGCGAAAATPAPAPATQPAAHQDMAGMEGMGGPALWAVQSGPLGVITTDDAGHMLYRYDRDSAAPSASTCTGACTQTWVPVEVTGDAEPELMGVDKAKVGRFTRPDGGVQLTLAGWPLYWNKTDQAGLSDAGHNGADGTWFAITPTGAKAAAR